jgi:hypothetical protein
VKLRRFGRELNSAYRSDGSPSVGLGGPKEVRVDKEQVRQPCDCHQHHCGSLQEQTHPLTIPIGAAVSICFEEFVQL